MNLGGNLAGAEIVEPYSPEFFADPYPTLRRLREASPVHEVRVFGFIDAWLVTRYDLGQRVLASAAFRKALPGEPSPFVPPIEDFTAATLESDPPDHTRLRKLMMQGFTNRRVELLRPRVESIVDGLLDAVAARGQAELISELAYPLALSVIGEVMGVPDDERAELERHTLSLTPDEVTAGPELMERYVESSRHMQRYFGDLVQRKRARPGQDVTSALIAARDGQNRLSEDELVSLLMFLLFAGFVTTVNLIASGVRTLLDHPDQLALLLADPSLVGPAVEECLRYQPPFLSAGRVAGEDMEFGGARLQRGDPVLVSLNAVNRDPARFPDPDRFDITRDPNPHLGFGYGIHHCAGAQLARLEANVAFGRLFQRFADLTAMEAAPQWRSDGVVRGISGLPVSFVAVG